jgi:transcriptional regulator with XRE-family HTH domain
MSRAIKIQLQQQIKTIMKENKLSGLEFAEQLGIGNCRLSLILNQTPSMEKLVELLDKLGYDVDVTANKRIN